MRTRFYIFIFIVLSLLLPIHLVGEDVTVQHFLNVDLGGGMNTMFYKSDKMSSGVSGGGVVTIQYQIMFTPTWGFGVGAQFSTYAGSTKYGDYHTQYRGLVHPDNGEAFTLKVSGSGREKQQLYALQVPLEVFYRHEISDDVALQIGLGISLDFPVATHYSLKNMVLHTSGVFDATGVEVHNIGHGFDDYTFEESGKLVTSKFNMGAQLDFSILKSLSATTALKMGIYANCGFINYANSSLKTPFNARGIEAGEEYTYVNAYNTSAIEKVIPFEVGLKIGIQLSFNQ